MNPCIPVYMHAWNGAIFFHDRHVETSADEKVVQ